ncbi:MAG TPA: PA2169 family four-helix-bundle protein [Burkholderiaceae bacterium]|jgi:uncharacterized protein (TIGR02284 family)
MKRTDIIELMNELVETARDGVHGFRTCAMHATADELRQSLEQRARAWELNVGELNNMIAEYGGTATTHGSMIGAAQRGWLRLREAVSAVNDGDLLLDGEHGEDHALARYRKAGNANDLPDAVRELINRQADAIEAHRNELQRQRAALHHMA